MESSDRGLWDYSDPASGADLIGYSVEATDGGIGKVDEATNEVGSSYIVVDTGPWIFGKKRMLPAGVIDRVDRDDEKVYVNRS
ncbi:MAG TPA: PRC-barrel domain containing protein, partial [Plantibacter sp.]|nr:PRC-barrel domain containing protein [Plantibacter sp.]